MTQFEALNEDISMFSPKIESGSDDFCEYALEVIEPLKKLEKILIKQRQAKKRMLAQKVASK